MTGRLLDDATEADTVGTSIPDIRRICDLLGWHAMDLATHKAGLLSIVESRPRAV